MASESICVEDEGRQARWWHSCSRCFRRRWLRCCRTPRPGYFSPPQLIYSLHRGRRALQAVGPLLQFSCASHEAEFAKVFDRVRLERDPPNLRLSLALHAVVSRRRRGSVQLLHAVHCPACMHAGL